MPMKRPRLDDDRRPALAMLAENPDGVAEPSCSPAASRFRFSIALSGPDSLPRTSSNLDHLVAALLLSTRGPVCGPR
jgi:hypothetical protein